MKIFDGQKGKRCSEKEYLTYTHRRCGACGRIKAVQQFYRKKTRTERGWAWDSNCIQCRRRSCRLYGIANRAKRNKRLRRWRRNNPAAARANDRKKRLKTTYGLSETDLAALRSKQAGKCAICRRTARRLFVDHCHSTGKVRGLLCQTCNTFLGWYENKANIIQAFQQYLDCAM